jgi:hypothetical protein
MGQDLHCNENTINVFQEKELCSLNPNFHIYVPVSDLYIPRFGPNIFCSRIDIQFLGIYKITHRHMNVEIGTEAAQFLILEYLLRIFSMHNISLQCGSQYQCLNLPLNSGYLTAIA